MNDLTKILFDYFKDNDIDPNKVANIIEDAKINVLDEMFGEEGEWVLKKLGSVESFDKEKIFHSIAQTSDSSGAKMNASDVNIIVEDVLKKMKSIKRNVYPTTEIRGYVEEALKEEGYGKVLEAYKNN
ncbi:MAG: ATP cone domain-containing protein [Finegoldia magna]|uniref:ATP cone domain-containing protein n=1 Tax=Finegoldia magna TaxID=1260 RepID=UPI0026EC1EA1|nr:ATP cone domain-containing protein [Finegoldia magna]MDU5273273.1 ATP cone domain-containing protein [Finegoldia magna]MDU5743118.1 ATP cone domain-containing protein [Finegoldia magna]MDU5970696.1 ATP cone domain-containing protein [Finegoldia magna]